MQFKRTYYDFLRDSMACVSINTTMPTLFDSCKCAYLYPVDSQKYVSLYNSFFASWYWAKLFLIFKARYILEIIVYFYTIAYLILYCYELYVQKFKLYLQTLIFNPFKVVFFLSLIATLLVLPFRIACNTYAEDILLVLALILKSTFILYLGR